MRDSLRGLRAHMKLGLRADMGPKRENWKAEMRPKSTRQSGLITSLGMLI